MTIDEAVNDFEQWKGIDARKYCSAAIVLADEYLRLTDETPATVEWLREVLGPPKQIRDQYMSWNLGKPGDGHRLWWMFGSQSIAIDSMVDIPNPTRVDVLTLLRMFKERKV